MDLPWIPITDWSDLVASREISATDKSYVKEYDVLFFVENKFQELARNLKIEYEELKPILEEENSAFFGAVKLFFDSRNFTSKSDKDLVLLEHMLKVPDISKLHISSKKSSNNVEKLLEDFASLTDIEKLEVLQRLKIISINIEFSSK